MVKQAVITAVSQVVLGEYVLRRYIKVLIVDHDDLKPSCIIMACVQVRVFVDAQLLTVDHNCMKVCKHTDQHVHAHLHLHRC